MKVTAALIVRDAAHTLEPCLQSIRDHVDEIVIVDTGSTDASPEIAKKYADKWERYTGCNRNPQTGIEEDLIWDFADARNKSFSLISGDCVVWLDADDVMVGAEHLRLLADELPDSASAFLIPYEYSYDAAGNPTCIHYRERLIRRPHEFHWLTPCHEVCMPKAGAMLHQQTDKVRILHRAQAAQAIPGAKPREPQRNLRILRAYLQKVGEGDPRAMYYAGVEYTRHGQFGLARKTLRRYVEISGWSDEKCLAQLELGRIALSEGDCPDALYWANEALDTKSWPDPYWLKCKTFCRMADDGTDADREYHMRRAAAWAERGRPLEDAQTVLFYNPTERYETERFVARIHGMFGDVDGAAEACRRGLKGLLGDADLMEQLKAYETVRIGRELDLLLGRLVHLGKITETVKSAIEGLASGNLELPPAPAANDTIPAPAPQWHVGSGAAVDESTLDAVPEGKLDIVIFTGPAMEPWNPETIEKTGIGGSETMAWEMARGLAKLGHRVRHYGMCEPGQEGRFDGVYWYDASRYRDVKCDVLVVSRLAAAIDVPVKARATLLWLHDVHAGAALDPIRAGRFDRVLCLSNWHKEFVCSVYPFLDPERVIVTRNGIDLSMFEGTEERSSHRAVYSSSPDRGLQTALALWPLVRAEVPDAELHVYYGFAGLRAGRPADVALADKLEATAKATPGVVLHGRIPPRELAREFMRSGVWFYPTWFSETSCITAMQAQAAGLHVVTSPIAALEETVGLAWGALVGGAPQPKDISQSYETSNDAEWADGYTKQAVERVVQWMTDERPAMRAKVAKRAADDFGLPALCEDWSAMLTSLVTSLSSNPVPPFYVAPEFAKAARGPDESEAAA